MNKGELKTQILDFGGRPEMTDQVDSFVELAEGLIRRDLRADVYTVTLDEDDRDADGVYTLPTGLLEIRNLRIEDGTAWRTLEQKSLAEIRTRPASIPVQWFAVTGDTVEFRGVPGTDAELELTYFGHPAALDDDTDTNALLTNHPALYVYGALFHLHQYNQDLELAQAALDTFQDTLGKLNEAAGRKLGGAAMRGVYQFGPVTRGY